MTMPTRTTSVSAAPAAARIAEVVKDLFSLGPRVLGDGVVQRVGPEQCGHVDPAPGLDRLRHWSGVRRRAVSADDPHETSRMG